MADTIGYFLLYGGLSNTINEGGSVAKAKDANVSIIKLTQSIYIELRGLLFNTTAPKNAINNATIFTVN